MTLSNVNSPLKFPYNKYCSEVGDDLSNIKETIVLGIRPFRQANGTVTFRCHFTRQLPKSLGQDNDIKKDK